MPGRITPLVNGEYYHIFNRGNDKREIFLQSTDYIRFIKTLYYYQFHGKKIRFSHFTKSKFSFLLPITNDKLVDIICYCLMPNHFHLLVKQLKTGGISRFISQLSNSYTKYFNTRRKHIGALFQGGFKSVHVENDEQFMHVSRYIHLNPIVSDLVANLDKYPWSSYHEYKTREIFCNTEEIRNFFKSSDDYVKFLENQIDYGKTLHILKKHNLDDI